MIFQSLAQIGLTKLFIITLFLTFIFTRIITHILDGPKKEAKTITEAIRKRTPLDFHHFHIGLLLLVFIVPSTIISGPGPIKIILLGFATSLVADQMLNIFLLKEADYFDKKSIILAIIAHLIIALSVMFG